MADNHTPLTEEELAKFNHHRAANLLNNFKYRYCQSCGQTWPCPTSRLVAEVERLRAELDEAQLRSIEARNPGIDMDEVRRIRAGGAIPKGEAETEHQRWLPR